MGLGIGMAGLLLGGLLARLSGASFSFAGVLLTGLNLGLVSVVWASLAVLASQLTLSRAVAGAASGLLMVAIHLTSNVAGTIAWLEGPARFLPTGAYASSLPLVPERGADLVGMTTLAAESVLLGLGAVLLLRKRDLNVAGQFGLRRSSSERAVAPRRLRLSSRLPGGPFVRDVWLLKGVGAGWALGLSALVAFLVSVEPTLREPMEELLDSAGPLARVFAGDILAPGALVALMFGTFLAPALAVFAVLQTGRFAGELEDGLVVLDLSTPLARERLLLARVAAVSFVAALALALTWVAAEATAAATGLTLDSASLAQAAAGALPVLLTYLGLGLATVAWWRPSWAAPVVASVALVDFVYGLVTSLLQWPVWSRELSAFGRYGNPAVEGLTVAGHGALLAAGLALALLASVGFGRRDLSW
jgi:ABC-2 type transport system permease protein